MAIGVGGAPHHLILTYPPPMHTPPLKVNISDPNKKQDGYPINDVHFFFLCV